MRRFAVSFLACLILFPFALSAGPKDIKFDRNGEFKILHLTDLHFVSTRPEEASKTFARMDYMVREEHPDFIAITGDVIFGRQPSRDLLQSILDRLDSYKIPFCIVFGNHDAEQDLSRPELSAMITSAKYSVNTLNEKEELADVRIPVEPTVHKGTHPLDLYFFDSHDYNRQYGGYAWLTSDQIHWLKKECDAATQENGGNHIPSMAFFHIPFPEFYDAWVLANEKEHNGVTGIRGEYGGHPKVNSGMFAAMLETGNIMGVFCGHDHNSDYIVPYFGIALVYGRFSGDNTVYNNLPGGARIITVKEDSGRAFDTWIHEDSGRIKDQMHFINGEVKDFED